jgi:ribosomal protein S18 acetylase RimI-like enzyme
VELLPWDTQFFGHAIGRTHLARADALESEIAAARQNGVDCLYIVIPEAGSEAVRAAMRAGSVLTGLRLGLEHRGDRSVTQPRGIRTATHEEAARVVELAVALSGFSRFAQDPRFPIERIEEMYRAWVLQDLQKGEVFVDAEGEGGMLALSQRAQTVAVDLVYVDDAARGSGVARALLDAAVASAAGGIVTVAADVRNVHAVRLYESAGFRAQSLDAILHLWLDDLS